MFERVKKTWILVLGIAFFLGLAVCTTVANAGATDTGAVCYATHELRGQGSSTAYCLRTTPYPNFPGVGIHVVTNAQGQVLSAGPTQMQESE